MSGQCDDIRIYNRALSQSEIEDLYNLTEPSGHEVTESFVPSNNDGGISRYKFEGDVTDNWGSNNGTDNTSVSPKYVNGAYGQAKNFDGNDDYITLTKDPKLSTENSFSISSWYRSDSEDGAIIEWNDGSTSNRWSVSVHTIDGETYIYARLFDNSGTEYKSSSVYTTGELRHVVATWNPSNGELNLYDNNIITNLSKRGRISETEGFDIGNTVDQNWFFDGVIDDLRIYDQALTDSEIENLFSLGSYRL